MKAGHRRMPQGPDRGSADGIDSNLVTSQLPVCKHCMTQIPLEDMSTHKCIEGVMIADKLSQGRDSTLVTSKPLSNVLATRRRSRRSSFKAPQTCESVEYAIDESSLDPLERLGYFIDSAGELRHISSRRHVKDEVALANFPEKQYAKLVQALVEYVQLRMVSNDSSTALSGGGFERIMVPSAEEASSLEARCPIFASQGWQQKKQLLVLLSSSHVQAGMWSRSVSFEHGIDFGSMLPYLEMAGNCGEMGVVVLNPYTNSIKQRDTMAFVVKVNKTNIRLSETPERHVVYCWDRFLRRSKADSLFFVCNGYGGVLLQQLVTERDEARKRISAVALTDSSHDWKSYERRISGARSPASTPDRSRETNMWSSPTPTREKSNRAYSPVSSSPTFERSMANSSPSPERSTEDTIAIAKLLFKERAINWVLSVESEEELSRIRERVGCECISLPYTASDDQRFKGDTNPSLINTKALDAIFAFFEWTRREKLVAPAHTFFSRRKLQQQKLGQIKDAKDPSLVNDSSNTSGANRSLMPPTDLGSSPTSLDPPKPKRIGNASSSLLSLSKALNDEEAKISDENPYAESKFKDLGNLQELHQGLRFIGTTSPMWVPDESVSNCMVCKIVSFGLLNRRHHCRACGCVVCNSCSKTRLHSKRVCDKCVTKPHYSRGSIHTRAEEVKVGEYGQATGHVAGASEFRMVASRGVDLPLPKSPVSTEPQSQRQLASDEAPQSHSTPSEYLSEILTSGLVDNNRSLSDYEAYSDRSSGVSTHQKNKWSLGHIFDFSSKKADLANSDEGFESLFKYDGTVCRLLGIVVPEKPNETFRRKWEGIRQRVLVQERICPGGGSNALALMPPCFAAIEAVFADKIVKTGQSFIVVHVKHIFPGTRLSLREWLSDDVTELNPDPTFSRQPWEVQSIVRQIFIGVSTLHSAGIAHGNLSIDSIEISWDPDDIFETRSSTSVSKQCTAIIHGLEKSVDVRSQRNQQRAFSQAHVENFSDYVAPEIRSKSATNQNTSFHFMLSADMWSLGVIFLRALLGAKADVVILNGTRVQLPLVHPSLSSQNTVISKGNRATSVQNNAWWNRTRELLHSLLSLDPSARPGSQQALWHPCFNISIAADIVEDGNIMTTENKIRNLQKRINRMMKSDAKPWMMMVKRDPVPTLSRESLSQFYRRKKETDMLRTMHVNFVGEDGIDAGGLRKDLFQTLFERVTDPSHPLELFEWRKGGSGCLPRGWGDERNTRKNGETRAARLKLFEGLGRAMLKALLDQITIPGNAFAPSLFRFLLGRAGPGSMPLSDLEQFDPRLASQLNDHILGKHIGDGSELGLDFSGLRSYERTYTSSSQASSVQNSRKQNRSRINSHEELSESNKREYVRLMVDKVLVQDRVLELEAIRRGFTTACLGEDLSALTVSDLRLVLCGPDYITSDMVMKAIDFDHGDWIQPGNDSLPRGSREQNGSMWNWSSLIGSNKSSTTAKGLRTINNLKRYIHSLDELKLRKFLRFATGSSALSTGQLDEGNYNDLGAESSEENRVSSKIRFQRLPRSERLPQAHTCFNLVEMPAYEDYETLKSKFDYAIAGVETAIGRE